MNTKQFTILHSNDLHGDFESSYIDAYDHHEGGLSLLSGYINRVKREKENVLYFISGDIVQGSLLCSEFQAISSIELINYLFPDAVALGNHEFDYGFAHLLFLEKLAYFPIVSANLYIKKHNRRIMNSHIIIEKDGFEILVIGILTEEALASIGREPAIAKLITIENACDEIGMICNTYKTEDIDLTIILTHIGLEEDKKLAAQLNPSWGVDMIIGGHSHTVMDKPLLVNNIIIAHAGEGTDQIGHFEITVDDDTNSIVNYSWELVPINCNTADDDLDLQNFLEGLQSELDIKLNSLICRLVKPLEHCRHSGESAIGNLFADILMDQARSDIALVGSGSIRANTLGPAVTLGNMKTIYPFDDKLIKVKLSGKQLLAIFNAYLDPENRRNSGEFYQISRNIRVQYCLHSKTVSSFTINGQQIEDATRYTVCFEEYHFNNLKNIVNFSAEETSQLKPQMVAHSCRDIFIEYLGSFNAICSSVEGRIIDIA